MWNFHTGVEESKVEMHGVETATLVFDHFSVEETLGEKTLEWLVSTVETAELEYFIMYCLVGYGSVSAHKDSTLL